MPLQARVVVLVVCVHANVRGVETDSHLQRRLIVRSVLEPSGAGDVTHTSLDSAFVIATLLSAAFMVI